MKNSTRASTLVRIASLLPVLLFSALSTTLSAQTSPRGPIASRKNFPTDLLFLSPIIGSAYPAGHKFSLNIRYVHSNTFVKSGSILDILPEQDGRLLFERKLAEALVANRPAEDAYFFDMETKRLIFAGTLRLSRRLQISAALPIVQHSGGFLDGIIEKFHSVFNISDDERPDFRRNTAQAFLYLDGHFLHKTDRQLSGIGPGDFSLQTHYLLFAEQRRQPAVALRFAVELPTGSTKKLHGNGHLDWGAGVLLSKRIARNALYLTFDLLIPGTWQPLGDVELPRFFVLQIAYERLIGDAVSVLLQANSNTNPFRGKTTTGLNGVSYELTLGGKIDLSANIRFAAALTENIAYFRNSPDLGFQLGLEVR